MKGGRGCYLNENIYKLIQNSMKYILSIFKGAYFRNSTIVTCYKSLSCTIKRE